MRGHAWASAACAAQERQVLQPRVALDERLDEEAMRSTFAMARASSGLLEAMATGESAGQRRREKSGSEGWMNESVSRRQKSTKDRKEPRWGERET